MEKMKKSRMTKQRRIILEEVKKLTSHPTADDIYEIVRERLPKISLGTVYRNLDVLTESGDILKLETSGSQFRFDGNTHNHYHVRCVQCGRVDDIGLLNIDAPEEKAREHVDYEILGHRLEFMGICPACRKKRFASSEVQTEAYDV